MSTPTWAVVAAEDDPARARWLAAARAAGADAPRFVSWRSVLAATARFEPGETVFCERLAGWAPANPVGGQRLRHREFAAAVAELSAAVAEGGATWAADPEALLLTLDRAERDEFLRAAGLPVLNVAEPVEVGRSLVRPRYAASDDWFVDSWHTTLFRHRTRTGYEVWRNVAEVGADVKEIEKVIAMLEPDGVYAVEHLHRAHIADDFHDIRFALLDGKVTHAAGVLRERIIAKPYYGGRRRELDDFHKRWGDQRWEKLEALAERTAALFPGIRSLGVDLIIDNFEAEHVFEVDPFGADLPGALGRPGTAGEGLPVKAAVLKALAAA